MEVVFGEKNLIMEAALTKDGSYIVRLQRISRAATPEILQNHEWKKYINNSSCILNFKSVEGLKEFIKLLNYLRKIMIEDKIRQLEEQVGDD